MNKEASKQANKNTNNSKTLGSRQHEHLLPIRSAQVPEANSFWIMACVASRLGVNPFGGGPVANEPCVETSGTPSRSRLISIFHLKGAPFLDHEELSWWK